MIRRWLDGWLRGVMWRQDLRVLLKALGFDRPRLFEGFIGSHRGIRLVAWKSGQKYELTFICDRSPDSLTIARGQMLRAISSLCRLSREPPDIYPGAREARALSRGRGRA